MDWYLQADNVANQREHLILLLSNSQTRFVVPLDSEIKVFQLKIFKLSKLTYSACTHLRCEESMCCWDELIGPNKFLHGMSFVHVDACDEIVHELINRWTYICSFHSWMMRPSLVYMLQ